MQSATAPRLTYSPDYGAESSFPERHLDDDKAPVSGIGSDGYQPSLATLSSHAWPSQHSQFHSYSHVSAEPLLRTYLTITNPDSSYPPTTRSAMDLPLRPRCHRRQPRYTQTGLRCASMSLEAASGNPHRQISPSRTSPIRSQVPMKAPKSSALHCQPCPPRNPDG
jgi:hypothetical protein